MQYRFSLLCVVASVWVAVPLARAADDWQYWNQFVFKHRLSGPFALTLASEQKWQDDFSDFYLYTATILPTVNLTKTVAFGAGYRWERREDDDWETENRVLFPLTVKWTTAPWTLQWRNQPEYRDLEDEDRWRIRERILVERPVRVGASTVTPFASEEMFYDFTAGEVNQNRLAVGLSLPLREHWSLTVFYMSRAQKDDLWVFDHVLDTDLVIDF